ncbi:MAG: hypothetical protein GQ569_10785 [Methylococcaceae bacterium]|nr:hypothetical protein [Methylococcaceae bacterium]
MQISISLPDELALEVKSLPNSDDFITGLLQAALQYRKQDKKQVVEIPRNSDSFWQPQSLECYLKDKPPLKNVSDLVADFWFEDEPIDDFVNFVYQQRQEDAKQSL